MNEPIPTERGRTRALAAALGVNRRRISKWREEGAPQSFAVAEWRTWLHDTGRTKILERLTPSASLGGPAPETAAAAPDVPPPADPSAPEVPLPDGELECPQCHHKHRSSKGASPAAWKHYWDATDKRESALNRRKERLVGERDLVPASEVKALLLATAAGLLESLGDSVWLALRPHLDGVPDTLRKTLRTTHDQAILAVRAKAAAAIREKFTALINPPAKPA